MSASLQCLKVRSIWKDGLSGNNVTFAVEREARSVKRCLYKAKREAISRIWLFSFFASRFFRFTLHTSHLIGFFILCDFFSVDFLFIHRTPSIDDVCKDEWNEETDIEHGAEGELTAA